MQYTRLYNSINKWLHTINEVTWYNFVYLCNLICVIASNNNILGMTKKWCKKICNFETLKIQWQKCYIYGFVIFKWYTFLF